MYFGSKKVEVVWKNLSVYVNNGSCKYQIIKNIDGGIGPSNLTALIGPSGSGKTSLLNFIAGRNHPKMQYTYELFVNGHERDIDCWPRAVAFVEKDTSVYKRQTVLETLIFAMKMRRSAVESVDSIYSEVDYILHLLRLQEIRHHLVSHISTGEMSRLTIGLALTGNPSLLVLDELLSALDSFNAIKILSILKHLSRVNKTVILSVNQPSYKMLKYFDKLILLSNGYVIYEGTVSGCVKFFCDCGFRIPKNTNPSDFFLETTAHDTANEEHAENFKKLKEAWAQVKIPSEPRLIDPIKPYFPKTKQRLKICTLVLRHLQEYIRDTNYLKLAAIQKSIFIIVICSVYLRLGYTQDDIPSRIGLLSFITINSIYRTGSSILTSFCSKKSTISREICSGMYNGSDAFISFFISEYITALAFNLTYLLTAYWIVGLNPEPYRFAFFVIVNLSIMGVSVAYAAAICAYSSSTHNAYLAGSTIMLTSIVFGGNFVNPNTIHAGVRWLIWVSPVYYAYEAMLQNQFKGVYFYCYKNDELCLNSGEEVLQYYGLGRISFFPCLLVIWSYFFALIIFGSVSMYYIMKNRLIEEKEVCHPI